MRHRFLSPLTFSPYIAIMKTNHVTFPLQYRLYRCSPTRKEYIMQNNPEITQKARKCLRKYRVICFIFVVCVFIGFGLLTATDNGVVIGVGLVVCLAVVFLGSQIIFRRCVLSVLYDKLDADTYLATVYIGKFDVSAAIWQLMGEYFCGHYANVVGICNQKLSDPKAKKYTYHYLTYLANVYFDVGDHQKLGEVYEQYATRLAGETPKRQAVIQKQFPRMTFYGAYLTQDFDACRVWLEQPTPQKINQYHRIFCKARLSLAQGDTAEAKTLFQSLVADVPGLNVGRWAVKGLSDIEEQGSEGVAKDSATFEVAVADVPLYSASAVDRKTRRIVGICIIGVAVFCGAVEILGGVLSNHFADEEHLAYMEEVRVMVEADYDGVVVLDAFNLELDGEMLDSMFICQTDTEILIGCRYHYEGDERDYYTKQTSMPLSSLTHTGTPLMYCAYACVTSNYYVHSYFYATEEGIPETYLHKSILTVGDVTLYYVITEVDEMPQIEAV